MLLRFWTVLHLFLTTDWDEMDINPGIQTEQTVDNGATEDLLPTTPGGLSEDNLRHLSLFGDLNEFGGDIPATRANDLCSQIFCQDSVLFQSLLSLLQIIFDVLSMFE